LLATLAVTLMNDTLIVRVTIGAVNFLKGAVKMSAEKSANIVTSPVRAASEPHIALSLVLDVSSSMRGDSITLLNKAVNDLISQLKKDTRLQNIIDLAIFVFGAQGRENVYQPFRAIKDCDTVKLVAEDNSSHVVNALEKAIEFMRNRCSIYNRGGGAYKPWIVLITDGEFNDDSAEIHRIGEKIKELETRGKLHFFGLGTDEYDRGQLEDLTSFPNHVIDANAANFDEFFSWVGNSMVSVSKSAIDDAMDFLPPKIT